jgi:hypothetical protein
MQSVVDTWSVMKRAVAGMRQEGRKAYPCEELENVVLMSSFVRDYSHLLGM